MSWSMFQYGIDATTSECLAGGDSLVISVSATRPSAAIASAGQAARAASRRRAG